MIIGVLEQIDILAFLSNHSHLIAEKLEVATNLDALTQVASQMNHTISALYANGMQAKQLAQLLMPSVFLAFWRSLDIHLA